MEIKGKQVGKEAQGSKGVNTHQTERECYWQWLNSCCLYLCIKLEMKKIIWKRKRDY